MGTKETISEITNLIDIIYDRFIMRDIFAKIVPGLLFISAILFYITGDLSFIDKLSQISWIILFGFAWIVAFGIQYFGELTGQIRYYDMDKYKAEPGGDSADAKWYIDYNKFLDNASRDEKCNCERLVVIKEATGNLGISLIISSLIVSVRIIINNSSVIYDVNFWAILIFCILFSILLFVMHRKHCIRQSDYIRKVIDKHE